MYYLDKLYNEELAELNRQYRDIFGEIPNPQHYRYQYINMYIYFLKLAVEEKKPLSNYLSRSHVIGQEVV